MGTRGGLAFRSVPRPSRNPGLDPFALAHLLWRDEAQRILAETGIRATALRVPRSELYRKLVDFVSERELTVLIKVAMAQREAWQDHPRLH